MMRNKFRWLLPILLVGSFLTAPAAFALGQNDGGAAGNRIDRRHDRRALRRDGRQVVRRQARYRSKVRKFGPGSPQARASRRQLSRSKYRYHRQARDLRQDRRQALRR